MSALKWYREAYTLTYRDVLELVYFFYKNGMISREFHDHVHALNFNFEVILDAFIPGWTPQDLDEIVGGMRDETKVFPIDSIGSPGGGSSSD